MLRSSVCWSWWTAVLVAAALALLQGCAESKLGKNDTLVISVRSNVGPLDPAVAADTEQLQILHPVYRNLVRIKIDPATGQDLFEPELAIKWHVSDDRLTWNFVLADDYRFDDGTAVNADAIKFTFDRLMAIGRAPSSGLQGILDRVETDGSKRVRFILKTPVPSLLPLVADRGTFIVNPSIMTHEVHGDWATQWLSTNSAGSGPYRLARYSPREVYILEPNPYAKTRPKQIRKIIYRVANDASIRALLIRNGDMDIGYFLPAETLPQFESDPRFTVHVIPAPAINFLAFNMENERFRDKRLREAIAYSIDYEAIVSELKYNLADPYDGPLLPGMAGYTPGQYPYTFDQDKARALVNTIAREGLMPSIQLIYPGVSSAADTMAIFIQSSFADIGLDVELQRLTVPALIDRLQRGNYDLVFTGWVAAYGDPANLVNIWFDPAKIGSAGNYARYTSPEVTALLETSRSEADPEIRAQQLREIVQITNNDLAYVYLVKNAVWTVSSARLHGLNFDHYNLFDQPFESITLSESATVP